MLPNISHFLAAATVFSAASGKPTGVSERQSGDHSMGFIGCSMGENVAQGYVAVGGKRMWGPYGTGALVVQVSLPTHL